MATREGLTTNMDALEPSYSAKVVRSRATFSLTEVLVVELATRGGGPLTVEMIRLALGKRGLVVGRDHLAHALRRNDHLFRQVERGVWRLEVGGSQG